MGGDAFTFKFLGLTFNATNIISGLVIYAIVFFVLFGKEDENKKNKGQKTIMTCLLIWHLTANNSVREVD